MRINFYVLVISVFLHSCGGDHQENLIYNTCTMDLFFPNSMIYMEGLHYESSQDLIDDNRILFKFIRSTEGMKKFSLRDLQLRNSNGEDFRKTSFWQHKVYIQELDSSNSLLTTYFFEMNEKSDDCKDLIIKRVLQ